MRAFFYMIPVCSILLKSTVSRLDIPAEYIITQPASLSIYIYIISLAVSMVLLLLDPQTIQQVLANLRISHIECRSEDDPEVARHTHARQVEASLLCIATLRVRMRSSRCPPLLDLESVAFPRDIHTRRERRACSSLNFM